MTARIRLIANDTRPQIQLTLFDTNTETPVNLTGCVVRMHFREAGGDTVLDTLVGNIIDPLAGKVVMIWNSGTLAVEEGYYEGEIEVTDALGGVQTMYDLLKFVVRRDF